MLYTQSALSTNDGSDNPSHSIGSIPSLPIVLTASVVFLAVDATITLFRRRTRDPTPTIVAAPDPAPVSTPPPPACQSLTRFVDKTRSILADVQALEKQLNSEKARRRRLSLERQRLSLDVDGRHPGSTTPKPKSHHNHNHHHHYHHRSSESASCAFSAFCDRLLLTNQIWKQEKELKALRASAASTTQARHATAFQTFCEQLLLWNRIWKLEREAGVLHEEKERIQRERGAAVTRAAKRMVVDVQKERLVEEFVKDLIGEVVEAREGVRGVRREWEWEVREIQGEWMREYRRVRGEVERLRLAQRARLVEQEVANSMEESLFERVREGKRRVEVLEEKIAGYAAEDDEVTLNDADGGCGEHDDDDDATDVELDTVSEMSTSSTCVSSGGSIKRSGVPQRRRCVSQGAPAPNRISLHSRTSTLPNVVDASSFTLKPLMIDHAKSASTLNANTAAATRTCNHLGRPLAVRNRTTSVVVRSPNSGSASGSGVKTVTKGKAKAPWRV